MKYINEDATPTENCPRCNERKLIGDCCHHDHYAYEAGQKLINPCTEIVQSYSCSPITFPNSFVFFNPELNKNKEEILRISKDGFWVRGVKVEQGENEAKEVYEAFIKLLGYNNA
jgi:uncharacterized protein YeaO (DUF488 family)